MNLLQLFFLLLLTISSYFRLSSAATQRWKQVGETMKDDKRVLGHSVALSGPGTSLAVSAPYYDERTGKNRRKRGYNGYVKVFQWNKNEWQQQGETFRTNRKDNVRLSLVAGGDVLAMLQDKADDWRYRALRVYDWKKKSWQERSSEGLPADGDVREPFTLSNDGKRVAFVQGLYGYPVVFEWNGKRWKQLGGDELNTPVPNPDECDNTDRRGYLEHVDLSGDGATLVVSDAFLFCDRDLDRIRVYEWKSGQKKWKQKGQTFIEGDEDVRVALNRDGTVLGVETKDREEVAVYDWTGSKWKIRGKGKDAVLSKCDSFVCYAFRGSVEILKGVVPGRLQELSAADGSTVVTLQESDDDSQPSKVAIYEWNRKKNRYILDRRMDLPGEEDNNAVGVAKSDCSVIAFGSFYDPRERKGSFSSGEISVFTNKAKRFE